VLQVPDHKVDELKGKLKNVRYVEEDKVGLRHGLQRLFRRAVEREDNKRASDVGCFTAIGDAALGYGVTVAVLDTGIDYKHPELSGKVVYCINTVGTGLYKGTNLGRCADRNGHGTHVAGIIAASLNNVGVAGVAPKVRLVAVSLKRLRKRLL